MKSAKTSEPFAFPPLKEARLLLEFLREVLAEKPAGKVKSLLEHGQILVDGKVTTKYNHALKPGMVVSIADYRPAPPTGSTAALPEILYEDKELLVINKPAGLLTISTDKETEHTAYRLFMAYVRRKSPQNRIFIVHRLDRDTSGVLLFAKSIEMKAALQDHWEELVTRRGYLAVVEGRLAQKKARLTSWLKETVTHIVYVSHTPGEGKEAITNYEVLRETPDYSYVNIWLETGRKNQIRVQFQELGHPVTGDKKYGAFHDPLKRLALHASRLELTHPVTEKKLVFDAPPPRPLATFVGGALVRTK